MDDLENLEYLGLVSKIASEIENHVGVSDKTLAEFVISTHNSCKSLADFESQLNDAGAEFPKSLVESIDRLILTLHPKHKSNKSAAPPIDRDEEKSREARVFKGLAIPDKELEDDPMDNPMDDTFAMLENLGGGKPKEKAGRKRSMSPLNEDYSHTKRHRSRSPRRSRNAELVFEEGTTRVREKRSRRKYRDEDIDEFRRPPTPELDDEPVLHKVYNAHVKTIKDFGAFCRLEGLKKRMDGLLHVSQIQEGARISSPADLLSEHQMIKVKVIKIEDGGPRGPRVSLSMKQVDQRTGRDLAPAARIGSGANSQALGNSEIVPVVENTFRSNAGRKRRTSIETWEIQQLVAAGVIPRSELQTRSQDVDEEGRFEEEEEVQIELRNEDPLFLAGTTNRTLELSPIRVLKAPEGSMARAATHGTVLAQERQEFRRQEAQEKAAKEAEQVDLSGQWNDPMAQQRQFASDLRNAPKDKSSEAMPEWKKMSTFNKGDSRGTLSLAPRSMKEQREGLPIYKFRQSILEAVENNQVLVLIGQTGSGKTTQLTQYLAEAGYANERMIGCTQPRRVAAMSVAKRVAEECGVKLGEDVGYTIRFEDRTNENGKQTRIKYCTDGILQREILLDPLLEKYQVIILDEAHERTISTDVLMGLLQRTLKRRPDLKLIVTSATMDSEKFASFYGGAPIFSVPGRTHPVEILYAKEPVDDYVDEALNTVLEVHLSSPPGDVLVFLTGKEEIDTACEILTERCKQFGPEVPELMVTPIYSTLPQDSHLMVFQPAPPGTRKVVIATNIAETSLTIDGIVFVVDAGFSKVNIYNSKTGMDSLQVMPISQAQANQRSGRAGRTRPGKCFRLYTEAAFNNEMLPTPIPDIQRENLSSTVLMLKAMGINDLLHFPLIDSPPISALLVALEELYSLGCLDEEGILSRLGRRCSQMPMNPSLSKALVVSAEMECSEEVLTIVSMISADQNVFYRPRDKQQQADQRKAKFHDPSGDHLTLLNVWNAWKTSGFSDPWCTENYIQPKGMRRVRDVRNQLLLLMQRNKLPIISCGRDTTRAKKALLSGLFRNCARKESEGYKTLVDGTPVYIHPSSALFGKPAELVMYNAVIDTAKAYLHLSSVIEAKWLPELAPRFYRTSPKNQLSKRQKEERIQPLYNKFAGEDDWRLSAQKRAGRGGGGTWG